MRSDDIPTDVTQLDFDRIIGGTPVPSQRKYPWVGWMGTAKNNFICTLALNNDRYMLTAAHCIQSNLAGTFYVTLGSKNLFQLPAGQSIQIAAKAIRHPNYNTQTLQNDIALLKLQTPLNFVAYPNIRPICLDSANPRANSVVTIVGWGLTSGISQRVSGLDLRTDLGRVPIDGEIGRRVSDGLGSLWVRREDNSVIINGRNNCRRTA
ncbi:unnamed protein product [Darwinula stevensoni]|uniref:Peptidase S1 domain-containing protein n=1 Tax=Darwinula stevensoni TaxID=69355 RepID=A0A7R9FPN4_9CRUS|nr:unnamed protein product [Darwinula stevensoni]CAG0898185.1 unnamed protein product [Darwinula stevensoni]